MVKREERKKTVEGERDGEKVEKKEMNTQSLNYAHSNFVPFHHFQLLNTAFKNELLYN